MKRIGICILMASLLAIPISAHADAKEQVKSSAVDMSGHVEVEGEDPVYPKAPEGYKNYEDYKQNTGAVHDTEFYYDQDTKTWYRYITNSNEIRSSKNLVNWKKESGNRNGSAWAPCIIKLREPVIYEGESYAYALWDSRWYGTRNARIRLWLSNSPDGGFIYAGNTITSMLDDGKVHNAIDSTVFYDKDGRLWMVYGSFHGGIFLIELNPETCMPMDENDIPGIRVAYRSIYGNDIEGSTIIYNPDTDYYYLNVSYENLNHTYNVRIGRSRNVEGPYYDYNGLPMDNEGYTAEQTKQIGTRITTPYAFEPDNGWYSTGHSSFLYNPDTNEYFLSHNARLETIANEGTRLNIRKIYWTEDGWPVVSPELYTEGEKEQKIPTRCIPGVYQIIEMLRKDLSVTPITSVKRTSKVIELKEDHTVSGAYNGTWMQTGDHTLQLTIENVVYYVNMAAVWDWENWTNCLAFTGISVAAQTPEQGLTEEKSGVCIWGKRVTNIACETPEQVLADFNFDNEEAGFTDGYAVAKGSGSLQEHDGGKALYLNGTSDFLEVTKKNGKSLLTNVAEMTVSFQAKPEGDGANWAFYAAPDKSGQNYLNENYIGLLNRQNNFLAERYHNNGVRPESASADIETDGWHYVTIVHTREETILYIDGIEKSRQASANDLRDILGNHSILYIGKANWGDGQYYKGLIDNYRILSYAMTAEQVRAVVNGVTLDSIHVTAPTKTQYMEGEKLNFDGMKVIAGYTDGTTKEVSVEDCEITGYDENQTGTQTVTVTYEDKKATFTVTVEGEQDEPNPPMPVKLPYVDVEKDAWYYDAVAYNYEKKTMTGLDDTHFGPADTLVRAQFAAVLHKMNKEVEMEYTDIFPDVTESDWFKNAVLWAADKKIVTGYTGSKMFGPNDSVTRAQMATMMYRYAKDYKGYDVKADGDYSAFPDAGDVQEFAVDAMKWAVSEGIITGKTFEGQPEGKLFLDPQGSANRAECATIIQRFMEKYEK